MQATQRHLIQVLQYHRRPRFAEIGSFLNTAAMGTENKPWDIKTIESDISELLKGLATPLNAPPQDRAKNFLLREELEGLKYLVTDQTFLDSLAPFSDFQSHCDESLNKARAILVENGLKFETRHFFVDDFPPPYDGRQYQAMNFDSADAASFGMQPGIYFRNDGLRPVYSAYIALHEIIHAALGHQHPDEIVSPLEEGLCELVGAVYLSSRFLGPTLTENLFIYNRMIPQKSILWDTYLSNFRLAVALFQIVGWHGIFKTLRGGRPKIKEAEDALFSQDDPARVLAVDRVNTDDMHHDPLTRRLSLIFEDSFICSPLAYYIARFLHAGATVREIAAESGFGTEYVISAIDELECNFNALTLRPDKSVVVFSDMSRLLSISGRIRYSLAPEN